MYVFSPPDPTTTIDVGQKSLLGMQVNIPAAENPVFTAESLIRFEIRFQTQESGESTPTVETLRYPI
jgi:hypothetical protein